MFSYLQHSSLISLQIICRHRFSFRFPWILRGWTPAAWWATVPGVVKDQRGLSTEEQEYGQSPARLLCPGDFPGKNNGVGCHFLLQGIFPTQESKPRLMCLLHWQVGSLTSEPPMGYYKFNPLYYPSMRPLVGMVLRSQFLRI